MSSLPDTVADHSMPALTGLRGFCALWVLVYHAWAYATPRAITFTLFDEPIRFHVFLSLGWAGVQMLFVLSAFLLTLPYARAHAGLSSPPRLGGYPGRRISRVFPAFYIQLAILLTLGWLFSNHLSISLVELPYYLFMLFMPAPMGVGSPDHINGIWWTLPIELSFYLVLPLIAWLARWRFRWLLLGLSLLSMAMWRYYCLGVINPDSKPLWVAQLPGSMDSFGAGMLGAIIHVQFTQVKQVSRRYIHTLRALLLLCAPLFFGLGYWIAEDHKNYWSVSFIMFSWTPIFNLAVMIVILNGATGSKLLTGLFANRWTFYLGTVSYGLYLWHAPAGRWLMSLPAYKQIEGYTFPWLLAGMFVLSLFAATLSWYLFEKRAIAFARRRRKVLVDLPGQ